jgi:hypothetical protein
VNGSWHRGFSHTQSGPKYLSRIQTLITNEIEMVPTIQGSRVLRPGSASGVSYGVWALPRLESAVEIRDCITSCVLHLCQNGTSVAHDDTSEFPEEGCDSCPWLSSSATTEMCGEIPGPYLSATLA